LALRHRNHSSLPYCTRLRCVAGPSTRKGRFHGRTLGFSG
jgi:hypothetical protein